MQGDGAAEAGAQPARKRAVLPTRACTGVNSSVSLVLCFKNSAHPSMGLLNRTVEMMLLPVEQKAGSNSVALFQDSTGNLGADHKRKDALKSGRLALWRKM